ncbi:glycosyltransferase family 2 protein [Thermodesulfobacteriota bacterium]
MNENRKRIILFIPAFNAADDIGAHVGKIVDYFNGEAQEGARVEVMVVDDGSMDGTAQKALEAGASEVISHPYRLGFAAATRTGLLACRERGAEAAVRIDPALRTDPSRIRRILRPVLSGEADIIFGPNLSGSIRRDASLVKRALNHVALSFMRRLLGWRIVPNQAGNMAYSGRYLSSMNFDTEGDAASETLIDTSERQMVLAIETDDAAPGMHAAEDLLYDNPAQLISTLLKIAAVTRPIKIFFPIGCASILFAFFLYFMKYLGIPGYEVHLNTVVILIISGIQTIFFGLLADLIIHKH